MVSGVMVAVLEELHPDHLVLSDRTRIPLPEGLIVERITSGSRVMILYSRSVDGGEIKVRSVERSR
jgi:hypothetical protein